MENSFEEIKISSPHYIYAEFYGATKESFIKEFTNTMKKSEPLFGKVNFELNVITKSDLSIFGYAYVWVSSEEAFNIIIGLNKDGSERIEEVIDEKWKPNPYHVMEYNTWFKTNKCPEHMSWAEISEYEEKIINQIKPPIIKKQLSSLFPMNHIMLDGKKIPVQFSRAWASRKDDSISSYQLYCSCLPDWVDEKMIHNIMNKYSTSKNRLVLDKEKNHTQSYPLVTIYKNKRFRSAVVMFDPMTNDGLFAYLMTKKIFLPKGIIGFDYFKDKDHS